MTTAYDFTALSIDHHDMPLADFRGKVALVVNVASKCGFTPQYAGLETLYRKFRDRGFVILGFPCNQFREQEPGSDDEIRSFCSTTYDVSFPMFARIDVNGPDTHPLYGYLKQQKPGIFGTPRIKWNFTKFLIDAQGNVVKRYGPSVRPQQIEEDIAAMLPS